ncbi:MAG: hypothetical protein ACTSXQ_08030 [Alphaproteobacteria bacterium]
MSQFTQWFDRNIHVNELPLSTPPKKLTTEEGEDPLMKQDETHQRAAAILNATQKAPPPQKSKPIDIPHLDDANIIAFLKYEKIWKELVYKNMIMDGSKIYTLQERLDNYTESLPLLKKIVPIGRTFFMALKNSEVEIKFEQFLVMRILKLGSEGQTEEILKEKFTYAFKTFAEGKAKRLFERDIRQRIADFSTASLGVENCRNILTKTGGKEVIEKEEIVKIDPLPAIMDKWGNLVPDEYLPEMAALALVRSY